MAAQIQSRRDTLANWTSVNPIIAQGEIAIEQESGNVGSKIKIGNGINHYLDLPYSHGFLPLEGNGITISTSGANYVFSVDDYVGKTEVATVSGGLQNQINQIVQEGTSIASSGGSILVHQDGTAFNLEVATAPIQNHNDLNGLQGVGGDGGYFHITEYDQEHLILDTEVASISGGLDGRLVTIENNYANKATPIAGTYNNVVVNSEGVVTSGANVSYALTSSIPTSASFLSDYDARYVNESDLTTTLLPYTLLSTTADISAGLQSQITSINVIGGTNVTVVESPTNTFTISTSGSSSSSSKFIKTYQATDVDSPNNSDWAVNAFAPIVAVTGAAGLIARSFSDTVSGSVGFGFSMPPNPTTIQINVIGKAQTTPITGYNLVQNVYARKIPSDTGVLSSWSNAQELTPIAIATGNTNWIHSHNTLTLSTTTFGISGNDWVQFQIVRKNTGVTNNLVGNWLNLEYEIVVE